MSSRRDAAPPMRRVLIIGSGGAGKSTLARALAARTGLPLIHLDAEFWRAGWVETPADEWSATVERLLARDAWIMDGNYSGTLARRLEAADTVLFLDLPRLLCLWSVVRRRFALRGGARPDVPPGCPERLTWEFVRWIWRYPRRNRPRILERLAALPPETNVLVLRTRAEAAAFVAGI